jgi:hypothetical protein
MRRTIAALLGALALAGSVVLGAGGPANADRIKDCGTTTTVVGPGNSGMTQTVTETQISQCHSSSDTGEVIDEGPVTNRGGGTPGGQQ